jgi:hypothetical protein
MPHLPDLRVVPLDSIRRHEEIDPLRVDRLVGRIKEDGVQVNPMMCVEGPGDVLVLLDGATRTESLRKMGLDHAVVQVVDPASLTLETWHHVVRGCDPNELLAAIEIHPDLSLSDGPGTPAVHLCTGPVHLVTGAGISPNATLSALVSGYVGRWTITRAVDPSLPVVGETFPDWAAVVEFPTLSVEDVMKAAVGEDLLPAGITRFLVPERALRLNVPLSLLQDNSSANQKQVALDRLLEERANDGRIRRYEEPVFILDD